MSHSRRVYYIKPRLVNICFSGTARIAVCVRANSDGGAPRGGGRERGREGSEVCGWTGEEEIFSNKDREVITCFRVLQSRCLNPRGDLRI